MTCLALWGASHLEARAVVPIFVSGEDRDYSILSSEIPTRITVRGPGELRIVTRAGFRPAAEKDQKYSILVRIDGGPEEEVLYEQVERSRTAMFRDGTLGVPGRLVDHRISLHRGYHNIEVRAAVDSPQVFFRHLFKPRREKRRSWVPLAPREGADLVELVVRETIVPYYRNRVGSPFIVEVIGPTQLRIFSRVENTPEMRGRIHYRLQVREGGRVINTFQLSGRRSDVATYLGNDELVPGRGVEVVVPVPEGRHRFEVEPIDSNNKALLARFLLPRADLSLTAD